MNTEKKIISQIRGHRQALFFHQLSENSNEVIKNIGVDEEYVINAVNTLNPVLSATLNVEPIEINKSNITASWKGKLGNNINWHMFFSQKGDSNFYLIGDGVTQINLDESKDLVRLISYFNETWKTEIANKIRDEEI